MHKDTHIYVCVYIYLPTPLYEQDEKPGQFFKEVLWIFLLLDQLPHQG